MNSSSVNSSAASMFASHARDAGDVKVTENEKKLLKMMGEHLEMAKNLANILHVDTVNLLREKCYSKGVYMMDLDTIRTIVDQMAGD